MASLSHLQRVGLPIVSTCGAYPATEIDVGTSATSQSTTSKLPTRSPCNIEKLLSIGPVSESQERAGSHRDNGGPRGQRARIAYETLQILKGGGYYSIGDGEWVDLNSSMEEAIDGTLHLSTTHWHPAVPRNRKLTPAFDVRCCSVLSAAQELATSRDCVGKVGVLNFASARNPGGGFSTGAEAQEECIARSSAIYPTLTKHFDSFFVPNRRCPSGLYTHDIIYSPQVPVIRDARGTLLDRPYLVDFATAAAPNRGVLMTKTKPAEATAECEKVLRERATRVLSSFAEHGAVDLVLGAWGCGVFKNEPVTVARIFAALLNSMFKGCFRKIIFAVLDPSMAKDFEAVFGKSPVASADDVSLVANGPSSLDTTKRDAPNPKGGRWKKNQGWKK